MCFAHLSWALIFQIAASSAWSRAHFAHLNFILLIDMGWPGGSFKFFPMILQNHLANPLFSLQRASGCHQQASATFHLSSVLMCSGKEKTSLIDSKSGNLRTLSELFPNTVVLQMEQFISILWASISSSVKWSRHIVCHSKLPCGTKEMEQGKLFVDLCLT